MASLPHHWKLQCSPHPCRFLSLCLAWLPCTPKCPQIPDKLLILCVLVQVSPPPGSLPDPCLDSAPFTTSFQLRSGAEAGCLCTQSEPRAWSRRCSASISRTRLGVTAQPEMIQEGGRWLRTNTAQCDGGTGLGVGGAMSPRGQQRTGRQRLEDCKTPVSADYTGDSVTPPFSAPYPVRRAPAGWEAQPEGPPNAHTPRPRFHSVPHVLLL